MPNNDPYKSGQMVGFRSVSYVTVFSSYCLRNPTGKKENATTFKKYKEYLQYILGSHKYQTLIILELSFSFLEMFSWLKSDCLFQ